MPYTAFMQPAIDQPPPDSAPAQDVVGCLECDLLVRVGLQRASHAAYCPRCGYLLTDATDDTFVQPFALALAALIFAVLAVSFPFLAVSAAGLENSMTLFAAIGSLARFGADGVAVATLAFVLLIPVAMMLGVVALCLLLRAERASPALVPLARLLFRLNAWSMADVFAIGVIVSLVKLSSMAEIVPGTAFWAYIAFTVTFLLAMTRLDRLTVWHAVDRLRAAP